MLFKIKIVEDGQEDMFEEEEFINRVIFEQWLEAMNDCSLGTFSEVQDD